MARYTFVVLTNPIEGQDSSFNDWYDNIHLGDVLSVPGIVSAQRFRACNKNGMAGCRYLALYEIESDDPRATVADMRARGFPVSDAMDRSTVSAVLFESVAEPVSAASVAR